MKASLSSLGVSDERLKQKYSEAIEESLKNRPAIVTADLVDNQGRRKILSFAARSFVNNHNERYWRIELLTPELRQLILKPHKGNSSEGTDD